MISLYKINLQLFADEEKTEKPTPKKRMDARKEGQVVQSREINSAFVLIGTFLSLKVFGKQIMGNMYKFTRFTFSNLITQDNLFTMEGIKNIILRIIAIVAQTIVPIVAAAFIIGFTINYVQVGFLFTTKPLKIKLNRINPIEGIKRIFSKRMLVELIKSIFKIFVIGYFIYKYIVKEMENIMNLYDLSINEIVKTIGTLSYGIAIRAGGILIIVSVIDYFYQWKEHEKNIKMTKKEIKEEYKQSEGDPQVKSRIKEKQRQIAMRRMMQEVPKADVIITNPTHYAVAIKYDKEKYDAPYVLAKGADLIAENIKKVARENNVPIVENKPLARMLYDTVDIDCTIPQDMYQAVAEVLAYVYSLKED